MSEKYKFSDPEGTYFMTMSVVGWIDLFTRPELKHVILDSLKYCQREKGLVINAWCLMHSHLHLIARTSKVPLQEIMRDFKKFTSKEIIKVINRINESRKSWMLDMFSGVADGLKRVENYKVWQDGNHPELIFSSEFQKQKLNYVHQNHVEAEFVCEPEYYLYNSARDYRSNWKGLIEIEATELKENWHALQTRANLGFQKQKLNYVHQNHVEAEFVCEPEYYLYNSARDYCSNWKRLIEIELLS